jgi:hypothetical protein
MATFSIPVRKTITLRLDANDVGQINDGLECRRMTWKRTARYLEFGHADGEIEECSSAREANSIAAFYDRIVAEIQRQLDGKHR